MNSFFRWFLFSIAVKMVLAQYGGEISNDSPKPTPGPFPASYGGGVPEFDCSGLENGNYPDPKGSPPRCNTFYYSCSNRNVLKVECPHGLYYDPDHDWCESKEIVEVCGGQKRTTLPAADVPHVPATVFDCINHEDGFYSNPKEKCSDIYYACSGGLARELNCPEGLVFDPDHTICNNRDQAFVCTGVRLTTMVTEIPQTIYEAPKHPVDCHGKEDGPHPDPTEKCSQVFYVCSNQITHMVNCAGNTYFDYSKLRCDTWINVFDCSGQHPTPSADVPATYAPKPVDFDCTNLEDGQHPDPKNKCSTVYYVCAHGVAHELTCPSNLYWDPDETMCNGYGNIYACTGIQKLVTETTPTTMLITSPPRIPDFPCSENPDGFYSDPQNKCSNVYFVCSKKIDHKLYCPANLYFDIESEMCEIWDNVYACSGIRPTPTTPAPPKDIPEPVAFDCHGLQDGDYPDPVAKCSHIYYTCSGGVATKRECAGDAYFDQEIDLCELYDNVPECSNTYRKLTTTPFLPHDVEKFPFECENKIDGNYPEGDCMEYYWSCVGGVTFKIECPMGLKYDIELNLCDWDYHIPKCGGQRPTPSPNYISPQPNWPVDCAKLGDGSHADPENPCSQSFYVCVSGQTNKLDCPGGLFFNTEENRCDLKVSIPACGGTLPEKPTSYNNRVESDYFREISRKPMPILQPHDAHRESSYTAVPPQPVVAKHELSDVVVPTQPHIVTHEVLHTALPTKPYDQGSVLVRFGATMAPTAPRNDRPLYVRFGAARKKRAAMATFAPLL